MRKIPLRPPFAGRSYTNAILWRWAWFFLTAVREVAACNGSREQARKYAFDWEDEPLLRVECGESFEIETYDASTGYFRSPEDKAIPTLRPGFDRSPPQANPLGGPVWLHGAERGDTLMVTYRRHSRGGLLVDRHRTPPRPTR